MKFAKLVFAAATMMMVSTSQANTDVEYASNVGVQVIARSVITQKLVHREERKVLALALETGKAKFGKMECDRALGSDGCTIEVFIVDDESTPEAEETMYHLNVIINQGTVRSANLELVAG